MAVDGWDNLLSFWHEAAAGCLLMESMAPLMAGDDKPLDFRTADLLSAAIEMVRAVATIWLSDSPEFRMPPFSRRVFSHVKDLESRAIGGPAGACELRDSEVVDNPAQFSIRDMMEYQAELRVLEILGEVGGPARNEWKRRVARGSHRDDGVASYWVSVVGYDRCAELALALDLALMTPILGILLPLFERQPEWGDLHPVSRFERIARCMAQMARRDFDDCIEDYGRICDEVCVACGWPLLSRMAAVIGEGITWNRDSAGPVRNEVLGRFRVSGQIRGQASAYFAFTDYRPPLASVTWEPLFAPPIQVWADRIKITELLEPQGLQQLLVRLLDEEDVASVVGWCMPSEVRVLRDKVYRGIRYLSLEGSERMAAAARSIPAGFLGGCSGWPGVSRESPESTGLC